MAAPPTPTADPPAPPPPPVKLDPLAALFSFLIPGLGQVYQGRVGKGLLFFFGLYFLFFYGMWMGQWRNVWLPDVSDLPDVDVKIRGFGFTAEGGFKSVAYRPQFLGQFWIGVAAWPAVVQYTNYDRTKDSGPVFGKFERAPSEDELNDLQRNGSKRWDLGWVYTVIAGVLNLLVIYDAFAGPMYRDLPPTAENPDTGETPAETPPSPQAAPQSAPPTDPTPPANSQFPPGQSTPGQVPPGQAGGQA